MSGGNEVLANISRLPCLQVRWENRINSLNELRVIVLRHTCCNYANIQNERVAPIQTVPKLNEIVHLQAFFMV